MAGLFIRVPSPPPASPSPPPPRTAPESETPPFPNSASPLPPACPEIPPATTIPRPRRHRNNSGVNPDTAFALIFANARSNTPAGASPCGRDPLPRLTLSAIPFALNARRAIVTAVASTSRAVTRSAPSLTAAMLNTPEPVPTSSALAPDSGSRSNPSKTICVVG